MAEPLATPGYELVTLAEVIRSLAEAENLDALLLAAATLQEEGQDLAEVVVFKGGQYDGATTALVQEGML